MGEVDDGVESADEAKKRERGAPRAKSEESPDDPAIPRSSYGERTAGRGQKPAAPGTPEPEE